MNLSKNYTSRIIFLTFIALTCAICVGLLKNYIFPKYLFILNAMVLVVVCIGTILVSFNLKVRKVLKLPIAVLLFFPVSFAIEGITNSYGNSAWLKKIPAGDYIIPETKAFSAGLGVLISFFIYFIAGVLQFLASKNFLNNHNKDFVGKSIKTIVDVWINLKKGFVVVPIVGQDKNGLYHSMELISAFNYLDKMALKEAILSAIKIGNPKVKALLRHEYPKKPELFKYLNCNSQKQVDRECKIISIKFLCDEIVVMPYRRLYPRGSHEDSENKIILSVAANIDELVDAVHNLILRNYNENN